MLCTLTSINKGILIKVYYENILRVKILFQILKFPKKKKHQSSCSDIFQGREQFSGWYRIGKLRKILQFWKNRKAFKSFYYITTQCHSRPQILPISCVKQNRSKAERRNMNKSNNL